MSSERQHHHLGGHHGPLLAFAVVGPLVGKLGDLRAPRRAGYLDWRACAVFAALTAVASSAARPDRLPHPGAATGAAVGPASIAIINRMFPASRGAGDGVLVDGRRRRPVIGVVAGGPIVETFGWRWIFIAQVPLMAGWWWRLLVLPETERPTAATRFDFWGAAASPSARRRCSSPSTAGPRGGGRTRGRRLRRWPPAGVAFRRRSSAGSRTRCCRSPTCGAATSPSPSPRSSARTSPTWVGSSSRRSCSSREFGYPRREATWLSIPRPLAFAIAGPIAGYLTIRVGERAAGVFGATASSASMLALADRSTRPTDLVIIRPWPCRAWGWAARRRRWPPDRQRCRRPDLGIAGASQQMVNQVGVVLGIQVMLTRAGPRRRRSARSAAYGDAYLRGRGVAGCGVVLRTFVQSTPRAEGAPAGTPSSTTAGRGRPR